MNKIKLTYVQPGCELLVVRFEENIMSNQIDSNGTQRSTPRNGSGLDFDGWDEL